MFLKIFFLFIYLFILFVVDFVIHWNETAMGLKIFFRVSTNIHIMVASD